jgi:hypothetical protein
MQVSNAPSHSEGEVLNLAVFNAAFCSFTPILKGGVTQNPYSLAASNLADCELCTESGCTRSHY